MSIPIVDRTALPPGFGPYTPFSSEGLTLPPGFAAYFPGPGSIPEAGLSGPGIVNWTAQLKQSLFIHCEADELLFGGSRGSGKSNTLLGDFCHHEYLYGKSASGILFRKTFREFQHMQEMAAIMFKGIASWNAAKKRYEWPSGAWLRLAYLEKMSDLGRYNGNQYTWMGFDELSEWASPALYLWMSSCLRTTDPNVRKRIVGSATPGRPGHLWVRQRFIDDVEPGHMMRDQKTKLTRIYCPALISDNAAIFENDKSYVRSLMQAGQTDALQRAMIWGDWSVTVGAAFPEWDPAIHVVDQREVRIDPSWPRYASVDWGTAKPYAILYFAIAPNGRVYLYHEDYGCRAPDVGVGENAATVAKRAYEWAAPQGLTEMTFDVSMQSNIGTGSSVADQFQMAGWSLRPASKNRIEGKAAVHRLLQTMLPDGWPMFQVLSNCIHFQRTFPALISNTRVVGRIEDVDTECEDHQYDAFRYMAVTHNLTPGTPRFLSQGETTTMGMGTRQPEWNPLLHAPVRGR